MTLINNRTHLRKNLSRQGGMNFTLKNFLISTLFGI